MEEIILVNEHVVLRPFEPGDKPNLVRYLNDLTVYRNTLTIPHPYTEADADKWFELMRKTREKYEFLCNWALYHAEAGVIGGIGMCMRTGKDGHKDEIGYWLAEPFWGRGITTEALVAVTRLAIETHGLTRVYALPFAWNIGSCRVLEKAGYVLEARLRQSAIKDGRVTDQMQYAFIPPLPPPALR